MGISHSSENSLRRFGSMASNYLASIFGSKWFHLSPDETGAENNDSHRTFHYVDVLLIVSFALLNFYFSSIWYLASDDAGYIGAARNWLQHFPFVSSFHGDLRHPTILPIAASIWLFGDSEISVAIPTIIYAIGTLLVSYLYLNVLADRLTALGVALFLSSSPLLTEWSTTPSVDICELFFAATSILTFLYATVRRGNVILFVVAGMAAGLSFMSRESAIALLALYGIFFVAGFGGSRKVYFVMAGGFAAVLASEMLLYWLVVGDPLYRVNLLTTTISSANLKSASGGTDFKTLGVFNFSPLVDPIIFVLVHPKFALMFPTAVCALVLTARQPKTQNDQSKLIRHFFTLGVLSFLVAGYFLSRLDPLPRYYLVSFYCMTIAVAIWVRFALWPNHSRVAILVTAGLFIAAFVGTTITNRSPMFAERVLASLATGTSEPIHTDTETAYRGRFFFEWANAGLRVTADPPRPGDLFFYNPKHVGVINPRTEGIDQTPYTPKFSWTVVKTIEEPEGLANAALRVSGIDQMLPQGLIQRMKGNPAVTLYRVKP